MAAWSNPENFRSDRKKGWLELTAHCTTPTLSARACPGTDIYLPNRKHLSANEVVIYLVQGTKLRGRPIKLLQIRQDHHVRALDMAGAIHAAA